MNEPRYYLIGMLLLVAVLIFPVATSRAAPIINSDPSADYFQRHPELKVLSVEKTVNFSGSDWYQRHQTELASSRSLDTTDYYGRYPELNYLTVENAVRFNGSDLDQRDGTELDTLHSIDTTDYYVRHFELSASALLH